MKFSLLVILMFMISAVVSAGIFFGIKVLDDDGGSQNLKIAKLEEKLASLEKLLKNENDDEAMTFDSLSPESDWKKYINDELESLKFDKTDADEPTDINEQVADLEKRLAELEEKSFTGSKEFDKDEVKSEAFKKAVQAEIASYFENFKKNEFEKKKKEIVKNFMKKFAEDVKKMAKFLGVTDEQIEQALEAGREHIENAIDLKQEYAGVDINSLPEVEKQAIQARFKELEQQTQSKFRNIVGDENFMKIRMIQRKEEFYKKIKQNKAIPKLEDWQMKKIDEALNRNYNSTSHIDMLLVSSKLTPEECEKYKKELNNSNKIFQDEVLNQILTEEQRKKLQKK